MCLCVTGCVCTDTSGCLRLQITASAPPTRNSPLCLNGVTLSKRMPIETRLRVLRVFEEDTQDAQPQPDGSHVGSEHNLSCWTCVFLVFDSSDLGT